MVRWQSWDPDTPWRISCQVLSGWVWVFIGHPAEFSSRNLGRFQIRKKLERLTQSKSNSSVSFHLQKLLKTLIDDEEALQLELSFQTYYQMINCVNNTYYKLRTSLSSYICLEYHIGILSCLNITEWSPMAKGINLKTLG